MRGRRKTAAGVFCVPVRLEYFFNSWGFLRSFSGQKDCCIFVML